MTQLNFISDVIKGLKKDYGQQVVLRRETITDTDITTGVINKVVLSVTLKQVIRLPSTMLRSYATMFKVKSSQDKKERNFIIDAADLKNKAITEPLQDDIILMESLRYNVTDVIEIEYQMGYYVTAIAVEGDTE